jgi:hypothetical protein
VNTSHEILDWFGPSRGVIVIRSVLMYYAIEIDSSPFLSGLLGDFLDSGDFRDVLRAVLDVDLSSLFIVGESPYRV